ncbi:MAG: 50S ribosomal protein L19e, partial [Thaumarchaeota archaeon]|nr:50S ribosomal protein L19e [Nitrososphaerota archaeon]
PFRGTSRGRAKLKRIQKRKRGTTAGSKKGAKGARVGKKRVYVMKVRALRYLLKVVKDRKEITNPQFWSLYKKVGGNTVRNKAHLRTLIDEVKTKKS